MKIETLLPLGKVDPGLRAPATPLDVAAVARDARLVEDLGYDGLVVEETKDDPYVVSALAAQATSRLAIGTAVAMAFPRSPTITALSAWTLQKLCAGRFTLGLGTQVRGHIERRYGLRWSSPGPWMREYVQAVRAVWRCWQARQPLDFRGQRYRLDLMVPLFDPGPIDHPAIPIHLAAVNPYLCRVAGEVADGLRPHPVCTPKYIAEVMLPAVREGAERAERRLHGFSLAMKFLFATAPDRAGLGRAVDNARARIAFYASTPAYRPAFATHGLGDLADRLKHYSREKRWEEMPPLISDEVLETYVVVGTHDEIAEKILARFGSLATGVEFSIPVATDSERRTLGRIVEAIRGRKPPETLARILVSA
ncbi:MAG: TIGR03617 family F420-dependent LLM class oxidoreductase [Deltaproteobacteria bacterium]|nr:TIGR03617 family F420-dependent LLM class oxidoreductase [Deltaproteobacteria bacterium]